MNEHTCLEPSNGRCGKCEGCVRATSEGELSPEDEKEHAEVVSQVAAEHGFSLSDWTPAIPSRGGDIGWLSAYRELEALHLLKSASYGTERDKLANFTESARVLGKPAEYPVLVRMLDKLARAIHMIDNGEANQVKEYPDLASLSLCAEALRRRRTGTIR